MGFFAVIGKMYRMPDPRKQPAAALVHEYKSLCHVRFDNREWDREQFPRCMRRAKWLLIHLGGDYALARQCLCGLAGRFEAAGLFWTLETVCAFSPEWLAAHDKQRIHSEVTSMFGKRKEGKPLEKADPFQILKGVISR